MRERESLEILEISSTRVDTVDFARGCTARAEVPSATDCDQLNLTPDQKAKADPFLEEDAKKIRALRDDSSLSGEDRKKKTAEIRKGTLSHS